MKILVQRVSKASVEVEGKVVGVIGKGALVFLGITHEDTKEEVVWLANKFGSLRLFHKGEANFQESILEFAGEALIVSQFTLYADCVSGRRPSLIAQPLYELFILELQKQGVPLQTGIFGANMSISSVNEGPTTIAIEKNRI